MGAELTTLLNETEQFLEYSGKIKKILNRKKINTEMTRNELYDLVYMQEKLRRMDKTEESIKENAERIDASIEAVLNSYTSEQIEQVLNKLDKASKDDSSLHSDITLREDRIIKKKIKVTKTASALICGFTGMSMSLLTGASSTAQVISIIGSLIAYGVVVGVSTQEIKRNPYLMRYALPSILDNNDRMLRAYQMLFDDFASVKYARKMKDRLWNVKGIDYVRTLVDVELSYERMRIVKTRSIYGKETTA